MLLWRELVASKMKTVRIQLVAQRQGINATRGITSLQAAGRSASLACFGPASLSNLIVPTITAIVCFRVAARHRATSVS